MCRDLAANGGRGHARLPQGHIHSAELNGVEPFEYLLELLKHAEEVDRDPVRWMPWNYTAAAASG